MKKEKTVRTVRVKVYKFKALSAEAKKKAIDHFRDSDVDYDWWIDDYGYFKDICATIGVDVDLKRTWFSGFSSQGDGAAFTADVDLMKLVKGIESKAWESVSVHLTEILDLTACPVNKRVLAIAQEDPTNFSIEIKTNTQFGFSTRANCEYWVDVDRHKLIDKEVTLLERWVIETINTLNHFLYSTLEKQYDYLISDESVKESIIANDREFTEDGKPWY